MDFFPYEKSNLNLSLTSQKGQLKLWVFWYFRENFDIGVKFYLTFTQQYQIPKLKSKSVSLLPKIFSLLNLH